MPTWDAFRFKYQGEAMQRERFEDLARALFCHKYGLRHGIYQCYNHAGNETVTVSDGSDVIGFNAKFFNDSIDIKQIIHSIETVHEYYPDQTKMLIYTNQSFGNPKKGNAKTAQQKLVDDKATDCGMIVEWISDKMILDQVMQVDWIYDYFFSVESIYEQIIHKETNNTNSIFAPIRSSIDNGNVTIKIPFDTECSKIIKIIDEKQHAVIFGEGGTGKTALLKDLWERLANRYPFCIRKAQDLKRASLDEIFKDGIDSFIKTFEDCEQKIFVIDSAERLQDLYETNSIDSVICALKDAGWSLLFTVRNGYLNELNEDLQYKFQIKPELIEIDTLAVETLEQLAKENSICLPQNLAFRERLCNLFYLSQYLRFYDSIDTSAGYNKFVEQIWKERIVGRCSKNGISLKRESLFKSFIKKRVEADRFYLNPLLFEAEPLQSLLDDEILGRNEHGTYITHDIYEEWGLSRIINDKWEFKESIADFFNNMEKSLLVRKEFRGWLSDKVDNDNGVLKLVIESVRKDEIDCVWKDEIFVGILQSTCASKFLRDYREMLLEDDAKLLNRIVFLLQLACKRLDKIITTDDFDYPLYVPIGPGWEAVIHLLYEIKDQNVPVKYRNKVLKEWTHIHKNGNTTREAGLMALDVWKLTENPNAVYLDRATESEWCGIVIGSAKEIREELSELVKRVVTNRWTHHGKPYYKLSHYILSHPTDSINLYAAIPLETMLLMNAFWKQQVVKNSVYVEHVSYHRNDVFGLNTDEVEYGYGPASALQTPIYYLLCFKPIETIQYVIEFVNYSISSLQNNAKEKNELEEVHIWLNGGTEKKQVGNYALWGIYRGACHIVMPEILQSIHMALEKFLLELADDDKYTEYLKKLFDIILMQSESVSLTAVVASVVMAHRETFWMYALNLFRTPELFHWDSIRLQDEGHLKWFYNMSRYQDRMAGDERIATLDQSYRKSCLESLCVELQYFRTESMPKDVAEKVGAEINAIIDRHFEDAKQLPLDERNVREILLYRMDRRKHKPNVTKSDSSRFMIDFNPQLPEKLIKESEETYKELIQSMRFSNLFTWCSMKAEGNEKASVYKEYEENPLLAIEGAREMLPMIQKDTLFLPLDQYVPSNVAGVMVRFYSELLNDADLDFCRDIIEQKLEDALQPNYWVQMSDGVESCAHAVPKLIELFPKQTDTYTNTLVGLLHNQKDVGEYKRVCDYVIETLSEYDNIALTVSVIKKYISSFQDDIDTESAEVLLELIPNNTNNEYLLGKVKDMSVKFAQTLRKENYLSQPRDHKYYDRHFYLYNAYASFLLNRPITDIQVYLDPFIKELNENDHSALFIQSIIFTEDKLRKNDAFWKIWELLYSCVLAEGRYYDGEVLGTYLFAGNYIGKAKEWHSLNKENIWVFDRITKDCGGIPVVLYSVAKNMNYLTSRFKEKGIEWMYAITSNYPDLELRGRESNTIFYMESFLGKYVRINRHAIKRDKEKRDKFVNILTFMVERNSVQAYMLRDMIA